MDFEVKDIENLDTYKDNTHDRTHIDTYEGAPPFPEDEEEEEEDPYYGIW